MSKMNFRYLTGGEVDIAKAMTWYALTVPPQREFVVQRILDRRGMTAFCPAEWRWRRKTRFYKTKRKVDYPAYPKYVFLGVPKPEGENKGPAALPWHLISDVTLIRGFIATADGRPRPIQTSDIVQVMKSAMTPLFSEPDANQYMQTGVEFEAGDAVRIMDGSLEGFEVRVERIEGSQAVCRFSIFGRQTEQTIPLEVLAKAA